MKCDFCSSSAVAWIYPAESAAVFVIGNNVAVSNGEWVACEECANLIDHNQREKLAVRSAETFEPSEGLDKDLLLSGVRLIQETFWTHRLGAQIPLGRRA